MDYHAGVHSDDDDNDDAGFFKKVLTWIPAPVTCQHRDCAQAHHADHLATVLLRTQSMTITVEPLSISETTAIIYIYIDEVRVEMRMTMSALLGNCSAFDLLLFLLSPTIDGLG